MARRYGKKKVGRARRYRKAPSTKRIARIAKAAVIRTVETKEIRYNTNNVGSSNFASISYGSSSVVAGLFGAIAQGAGQANRIGSKILVRGIRIFMPLSAGDTTNQLRFICVSPKSGTPIQPGLVGTFVTQLLSNATSGSLQWTAPVDTIRWKVHFDRTFFLTYDPVDGSTNAVKPRIKFFKTFVKLNRTIFWDDVNTINNDVYLIAISDSAAAPNPGVIGGFVNCYYKDA